MAWNRPTSNTGNATSSSRPSGRGKMPRLRRGLIAGAIVVLGAGLAVWLLTNGEAASSPLQKKDRGLIKEVKAATVKKAVEKAEEKTTPVEKLEKPKIPVGNVITANGACAGRVMRLMDGTVITNRPRAIFERDFEKALMVALRPDGISGALLSSVRESYSETQIMQMLKELTLPKADDPPGVQKCKEQVQALKEQILLEVDSGRSLSDVLDEIQHTKAIDHMINVQTMKLQRDAEESGDAEAVRETTKRINKMRADRGLAPLEVPDEFKTAEQSEQNDDTKHEENENE